MPTLQFKGKSFVQNHHLAVPYHQLVPKKDKSLTEKVSLQDNLIIHGDNLLALKALLPTYTGKIKCIYIDPPYNTGNEGWIYNDNVKSPIIKEWIGKTVGKEGEDLTRHDKWLCMMMPRLKLLKELLAEDGVIFISIDDNEVSFLKVLMDEVFGQNNFVAEICVQLNPRGRTLDKYLAKTHEYLLTYVKNSKHVGAIRNIAKSEKQLAEYQYEDAKGRYRRLELRNRNPVFNRENRPNLYYPFYVNNDGSSVSLIRDEVHTVEVLPINSQNKDGCWTWSKKKVSEYPELLEGNKTSSGKWRIFRKDYAQKNGINATTKAKALWIDSLINNENGKEMLGEIFGESPFDFPKSPYLIKKCLELGTTPNEECLVLDSFAGSGTTAQAVLELNKEDGGNRKFILVEMEDYADRITAERVRRVIDGVPTAKNESIKEGLGGTFSYFELGDPIEASSLLDGSKMPSYLELARYVYYTATGEEFNDSKFNESKHYVGRSNQFDVYMYYQPNIEYLKSTALTLDEARRLRSNAGSTPLLVFAPTKYVEQTELDHLKITFSQLPFEIYKVNP